MIFYLRIAISGVWFPFQLGLNQRTYSKSKSVALQKAVLNLYGKYKTQQIQKD